MSLVPAEAGTHMWTAPGLQERRWRCGSKRLRSYVRPVDAVAHDRCQDGLRDASPKQFGGVEPTTGSHGVSRALDRSITPPVVLEQAAAHDATAKRVAALKWFAASGAAARRVQIVAFAADHQLPGDARHLVGQR